MSKKVKVAIMEPNGEITDISTELIMMVAVDTERMVINGEKQGEIAALQIGHGNNELMLKAMYTGFDGLLIPGKTMSAEQAIMELASVTALLKCLEYKVEKRKKHALLSLNTSEREVAEKRFKMTERVVGNMLLNTEVQKRE